MKNSSEKGSPKKKKNHSDLGPDFVPPDGGFGWIICLAAGCSNLSTFPVLQQFGLLFRERLSSLQISSSEITTIININQAATSLIGLANGPVFRRFSFRQVALFGSTLVSLAIFFTSFANSFITFLLSFSILYGAGVGLTTSSNALALNTYFKEKRRIVMGISWSCTALGPIVFPYIVTYSIIHFGVSGTVLLFCGLAMNAICCALLLQPVIWHVKKKSKDNVEQEMLLEIECPYCKSFKKDISKRGSVFSSQYLFNADEPATPMLAREGWYTPTKRSVYSSKMSLASKRVGDFDSKKASNQNLAVSSKRPSFVRGVKDLRMSQRIAEINQENESSVTKNMSVGSFKHYKTQPATPMASRNSIALPQINENKYMIDNHSVKSFRQQQSFKGFIGMETDVLNMAKNKLEEYINSASENNLLKCTCEELKQEYLLDIRNKPLVEEEEDEKEETHSNEKLSLCQKIIIFFDLDLLKDWSYLNIMIGITLANFAELNFSILTPFVLSEFGLNSAEIATCMSILGIADICCRFFIPFVANYTRLENRTFFLLGVVNMAIGRIVLAHFHTFTMSLIVALWIGFNKGLRTVFMALCIPSHVEISRLPSAMGIHLLFSGLFYIFMGPVVGFIRDHSNYVITLHCLNITTFTCAISWMIEKFIKYRKEQKRMKKETMNENFELQ